MSSPGALPLVSRRAGLLGSPLAGGLAGTTAMVCVGSSVAVSGTLAGAPVATAQALRYAAALVLLLLLAGPAGQRVPWPRGREWAWLLGVVATGMVLFNVALVAGSAHAEPAVLGVAVACVPLLLAVAGPLLEGRRPSGGLLLAAGVVTAGAALVEGGGRATGTGLLWALVVLLCEAAFTLLAVPVLGRLGAWGVSVHATWLAAAVFGVAGLVHDGPGAAARLDGGDWLAALHLAVAVTAVAFVLWYTCVRRLGAGRAGLLTGIAPVSAAATGVLLGGPAPGAAVWAGIGVVAAGLVLGLAGDGRQLPGRSRAARSQSARTAAAS